MDGDDCEGVEMTPGYGDYPAYNYYGDYPAYNYTDGNSTGVDYWGDYPAYNYYGDYPAYNYTDGNSTAPTPVDACTMTGCPYRSWIGDTYCDTAW
jgi:hypothetical protein